jgi:hypothetical protein
MTLTQVFKTLLRLYPREHRVRFGEEMLAVFESVLQERRGQGRPAWVRLVMGEFAGAVTGAAAAWMAHFTRPAGPVAAIAGANLPQSGLPEELVQAQQRVDVLVSQMVQAIAHHQFEKARAYSNQEHEEREKLRRLRQKYNLDE